MSHTKASTPLFMRSITTLPVAEQVDTRGKALDLVFKNFPLRMSTRILIILPRMFRGFHQSIQANAAMVSELRP
jgi:hypothetical protein